MEEWVNEDVKKEKKEKREITLHMLSIQMIT